MADNQATMIIDGKVVPRQSEGTVFGEATLNDRIRDEQGKLEQDLLTLNYGGVLAIKAGSDTVAGVDLVEVTSLTLNKEEVSVEQGKSVAALVATVLPANATEKTVSYRTRNKNIATVDQAGVITGVSIGNTTIEAIAGDRKATVAVAVTAEVEA